MFIISILNPYFCWLLSVAHHIYHHHHRHPFSSPPHTNYRHHADHHHHHHHCHCFSICTNNAPICWQPSCSPSIIYPSFLSLSSSLSSSWSSSLSSGDLKIFRKYRSQLVRNTVRSFGEIHLTMFEQYSKKRIDPDFLWHGQRTCRALGILVVGYITWNLFLEQKFILFGDLLVTL